MFPKKTVLVLVLVVSVLGLPSLVEAMPDPYSTLTVWPFDTPEGAEGPIVTMSPADLIIYNTDSSHILDDVWLMLVINEAAKTNLVNILTNTSLTFLPQHFFEIPGTESPDYKIPPFADDLGTSPLPPPYAYRPNGWPGMEPNDQYNVGSLRSVMGIPSGQSMYYAVGDLDSSSEWDDHGPSGLNKGDPEYFTITVNLEPVALNWKVLVLALGHSEDYPDNPILNVHSPYTRSTLIVSELKALLLALAPISAFGLYAIKRKLMKK